MQTSDKITNYYLWLNERGINMPVFHSTPVELNPEVANSENDQNCPECRMINDQQPGLFNSFGGSSPQILFIGDGKTPVSAGESGPLPSGEKNLIENIAKALGLNSETFRYTNHNTCERHFIAELKELNPLGIVLLGSEALNLVSGKTLNFAALRGKVMTPELYKIPTIVTHHLREMIKNPDNKSIVWNDLKLLKDHLDQHQERK